jgi:hypothetical protein
MQPANKVNWLRASETANGIALSVSDNTGIVKVEIPGTGRRAPVLYRDEILALLDAAQAIRDYLDANDDVAFSKDQAKDSRKIKQEQTRAASTAAKGLQALGFTNEQIAAMLANKAG